MDSLRTLTTLHAHSCCGDNTTRRRITREKCGQSSRYSIASRSSVWLHLAPSQVDSMITNMTHSEPISTRATKRAVGY